MSFLETPNSEVANTAICLHQSPKHLERIKELGKHSLVFGNPKFRFTHQAMTMLMQLNDFDAEQVLKEIGSLASNPTPSQSVTDPCNWLRRLWRCSYPFHNYHYVIKFSRANDNGILIEDVYFDRNITGSKRPTSSLERNLLYHVSGNSEDRFHDVKAKAEAQGLAMTWDKAIPVNQIDTRHAAVNGMQNDLVKAQWLMGTHLDVAYPAAKVKEYTLFHNPEDGNALSDLAECLWDKLLPPIGVSSCQVRHLSAVLWQRQLQRQPTDWVVHSQGAIIFKAAVNHHIWHRGGAYLDMHTVAFHAGGSVIASTRPLLQRVFIKIGTERINPFDVVPNIAGHHTCSPSGMVRALRFLRLVLGDNGGNPAISPHTLPYLGVRTFYLQLKEAGCHKEADTVAQYMQNMSTRRLHHELMLNDPNANAFPLNPKKPVA